MPEGHSRIQRRFAVPFLVVTLLGCGARALPEGGEEDPFEGGGGSSGGGGRSSGSQGGAAGTRNPGQVPQFGSPATPLPACEPGFRPGTRADRECNFVYDGLCYEDENVACACARCTGQGCQFAGFLNPDEPQTVSCRR